MKLLKPFLSSLVFCALPHVAAAQNQVSVNPYGTFLEGDGVEIEMAQFAKKNADGFYDVLLKITGAKAYNAGVDGKTIKYVAVPGGTGVDYQADGKTRMIVRNPWGDSWSQMEIFLDGKTIRVHENKTKSKDVRPLHLLTEFKSASTGK